MSKAKESSFSRKNDSPGDEDTADKIKKETIHAKGLDIGIYTYDFKNEYVSLTDIAKYRSIQPAITIHNWLRGRDIVEFLGLWESLHNPDFKLIEFDKFKNDKAQRIIH